MELLKGHLESEVHTSKKISTLIDKHKQTIILTILSILIARLNIFSQIAPLGLPFVAASSNLFVLTGALVGIITNTSINPFKYILSLICGVVLIKFVEITFPKINKNKIVPILIFTTMFVFNMIFIMFTNFTIYDFLLGVFESFISMVFYYIINKSIPVFQKVLKRRYFTTEEIVSTGIIVTCAVAGLGNIPIPFGISIKNIAATFIVLICSMYSSPGVTAQVSAFMGIATGLNSVNIGLFVGTFSINALFSSVFAKFGKLFAVLGFTLGNVIISILLGDKSLMLISFLDILIGSLIFIIIPETFLNKLFNTAKKSTKEFDKANVIKDIATIKLDKLGLAFQRLSDTISHTITKTKPANLNNVSTLFDAVADKVCKKCALRFYCWQKDYDTTVDALMKVTKSISENGTATIDDFPEFFPKKCLKSKDILNSLISLFEIYRLNTVWQNKMLESTNIYKEQFLELSRIVANLKEEISHNPYFDKELSIELSSELEKAGVSVKHVNVIKDYNNRIEIELTLFPCEEKDNCCLIIASILEEIFDAPFYKVSGNCSFKECKLVFKESEIYSLNSSVKQQSKIEFDKNGDSYLVKNMDNGTTFIALCDGSGSGKNANAFSSSTLKLLEEFINTGFSKTSTIKLINASLLHSAETDYFSTVDLCLIDLKNGDAEIIKKGAAPTYIKRANGEIEAIKSHSLPIGMVSNPNERLRNVRLKENDIIIMVSDGICDALPKEDWIIDALNAINFTDCEQIADVLIKIASSSKLENKDDMTVLVSKVLLNKV